MRLRELVVRLMPARLVSPTIQRRTWTKRRTTDVDDHLKLYWEDVDNPRRQALLVLLEAALRSEPAPHSVLEFGSHVGVNLRLLAERVGGSELQCYAVEPNPEAVGFLEQHLPRVETLRADHRGFLNAASFPGQPVTVSFANGVLYSMSPSAARRVVRKMLSISSTVVIGDNLDHVRGRTSAFVKSSSSFAHPFETWFRSAGVGDIAIVPLEGGDYALSGFVIARSHRKRTSPD